MQTTTHGDAAAIEAAGYELRAETANRVTELAAVEGFNVTTSNTPCVFDFTWDKRAGAASRAGWNMSLTSARTARGRGKPVEQRIQENCELMLTVG